MNIFEQHSKLNFIKRDYKEVERINQKKEIKNCFICCMTGAYELKKYLDLDVCWSNAVMSEIKSAKKHLEKAYKAIEKKYPEFRNLSSQDIKDAKDELIKKYDSKEKEAVKVKLSSNRELERMSMINIVMLKLEDYVKLEYLEKEARTNIKYARTYMEKFVNLVVEVAS